VQCKKKGSTVNGAMEKKMTLLTPKLALSALGIVTMITGLAFAQQYTSQVNRSGPSSVLEAVDSGGELPQYEVAGFPISPHQISVLGSGDVQEQSLSPTLTLNGMPASPHQIAVIEPRSKQQMADKLKKRRIWN
jgi:hypothetical protein